MVRGVSLAAEPKSSDGRRRMRNGGGDVLIGWGGVRGGDLEGIWRWSGDGTGIMGGEGGARG